MSLFAEFGVEDDLDDARAVPKVDKDQASQVSPPADPAHQGYLLPDSLGSDIPAVTGPFQIPQRFSQFLSPIIRVIPAEAFDPAGSGTHAEGRNPVY